MSQSSQDPLVRSSLIGCVLGHLRRLGFDPDVLLRQAGLPAAAESTAEIIVRLSSYHALMEAAEEMARDPFLGLHIARDFRRSSYDVLELSFCTAATILEGLERNARLIASLDANMVLTVHEHAGSTTIDQHIEGAPVSFGRHGNEFFICSTLLQIRRFAAATCIPHKVWFAHPAPLDRSDLIELLGTSHIDFDSGQNGMQIDSALLREPLAIVDPPLPRFEFALPRADIGRDLLFERARQSVQASLTEGCPNIEAIARLLKLSVRTLQRRLAAKGWSFAQMVDSVRRELADRYLTDPSYSLCDIAYRLGYSDFQSFLRAFKRWTGITPGQFRKHLPPSAVGSALP